MTRRLRVLVPALLISLVPAHEAPAATNSELVPGSRIVFPYYDLRPGSNTFLIFTNVGLVPVSVSLEFYDLTCIRRDSGFSMSEKDVDLVDLGRALPPDPSGTFRQGFVDAATGGDSLIGTALIVNTVEDWAVMYHGAAARRQVGGATPFEPYPSRLFLPAFLTPGSLGGAGLADGLLILAAPHPTIPGGPLPEQPIQVGFSIFLERSSSGSAGAAAQSTVAAGNAISSETAGHQVITPIGEIVGSTAPPTLGWLSIINAALDDSGNPFGMVGLYIQMALRPEGGMAIAIRLPADPSVAPGP